MPGKDKSTPFRSTSPARGTTGLGSVTELPERLGLFWFDPWPCDPGRCRSFPGCAAMTRTSLNDVRWASLMLTRQQIPHAREIPQGLSLGSAMRRRCVASSRLRCSPRVRYALVHDIGIDVDHRSRGSACGQQCFAERRTGNGLTAFDCGQDLSVDTDRRRRIRRSNPGSIRHLVPTRAYKERPVSLLRHCCLPSANCCSRAGRCHRHNVRRSRQGRYFTSARKLSDRRSRNRRSPSTRPASGFRPGPS